MYIKQCKKLSEELSHLFNHFNENPRHLFVKVLVIVIILVSIFQSYANLINI